MAQIDAFLSRQAQNEGIRYLDDILELYSFVQNADLQKLFAHYHTTLNDSFTIINHDIRKGFDDEGNPSYLGGYFHAQDSRDFLDTIDEIEQLKHKLDSTPYAFFIDPIYVNKIRECRRFVASRNGSTIPDGFEPINIIELEPVFQFTQSTVITQNDKVMYANMRSLGEGSYARVFMYIDPVYQIPIALKRAKSDLNQKELERFKQEFEVLKTLNSPYIIEVYSYNEAKNEYTMEYMDESIYNYVLKNNTKLTLAERKRMVFQVCHAMQYIHSKGLLHRDLSEANVFVKHFEDINVVKVGDFGLVKIPDSIITSDTSSMKGALNDPDLIRVGYGNYQLHHEMYALTRLCYFILTGRRDITRQKDGKIKEFWLKGTNPIVQQRFKSADEIGRAVQVITDENK